MDEHFSDKFVKQAKSEGYRARSVFKLEQIDKKHRLLKPGMKVVDLGSAPGGWSQYVVKKVGSSGSTVAMDILDMPGIAGVEFIKGDFTDQETISTLEQMLAGEKVDVVLSDMAPNMSGNKNIDQPRSMVLVELALEFAQAHLKRGGTFCVKVFHGEGQQEYLANCRQLFEKVSVFKPEASRARSPEVYIVAHKLKKEK